MRVSLSNLKTDNHGFYVYTNKGFEWKRTNEGLDYFFSIDAFDYNTSINETGDYLVDIDLRQVFDYLIEEELISRDDILPGIEITTEIFDGTGELKVRKLKYEIEKLGLSALDPLQRLKKTNSCHPSSLRTRLQDCDLQGVDLQETNLEEADLRGANLGAADLRNANLEKADLRKADLQGADLQGADLEDANLNEANLYRADLRGANLQGAILREVNFEEANLQGALLDSRGLAIARASGAVGLSE